MRSMETRRPTVRVTLKVTERSPYFLMGQFSIRAAQQGWPEAEIKAVLDEAKAGDFEHTLATLGAHVEEPPPEPDGEA